MSIAAILAALACCALIYLAAPAPSPNVALAIGPTWHSDGTNIIISVDLANHGVSEIEHDAGAWQLLVEIQSGWKIITGPSASTAGGWIAPGGTNTFTVPVPAAATDWMLTARYSYYRQRDFHRQVLRWIDKSHLCELAPEFAERMKRRFVLLQEGKPTEGVIKTSFYTNLPPTLPWPPK